MEHKQIIIENIWSNPAPVFGGEWTQKGKAWQTQRGAIRLLRTASGANLVVWGNHNSGFAGQRFDVFTYLQERVLNTSDFADTLRRCAEIYGVKLEYSREQAEKIQRQRLAREVAPSLISALMENRTGKAWEYLTNVRGIEPDGVHFGELTPESIQRAKDALKARGLDYSAPDWDALGLTEARAAQGYNVVIPYYQNGIVTGFVLRNAQGKEPKYLYSDGLGRGGYCDRLTHGEPAIIVEGQFDAIRLIAAGYTNVIAMGGAKMGGEIARLFDTHEIRQITYIPDLEFNKQGEKKTKLISEAIQAFQSATVEGQRVITHLYIGEIPTPEGVTLSDYKTDADTYGKEQGADALRTVVANASEWWDYELAELDSWATDTLSKGATLSRWEFERRFMDIYNRCATPIERERIRQNINGVPLYAQQGITPAALLDVDEWNRITEYNNRIKEGAQDLTRAVENGANPATVGDILAKMAQAQSTNTRDEWEKQLTATFADELRAIQEQPDTLKTKWELGYINPMGAACMCGNIEYYPATITVFCAPTSHGKTMVLLQSALDLVQLYQDKTFLYVSCEENNRQLLERALNVYLDIPTEPDGVQKMETPNGKEIEQNYCFVTDTRKRAIKAALRGGYYPDKYTPEMWQRLNARITEGVKRYGEQVRPRLKLIHTQGSAESIAANVRYFVEQYRAQGVDVGGVFVDYMQLLSSDNRNTARNYELKDICKALNDCAAETELPIIVAAQLNRESISAGVDAVTVANLGEGADIERIAHDIYLIWQVDKTKQDLYYTNVYPKGQDGKADKTQEPKRVLDYSKTGDRSRRIFQKTGANEIRLKEHNLYIEQLKARDGKTGVWGLFPFDGERGHVGTVNRTTMEQ